jgi:hypothetical protein
LAQTLLTQTLLAQTLPAQAMLIGIAPHHRHA